MNGFPVHGANLAWAEERYGVPAERFLDFSSNVNPLGPPASALEAARVALDRIARYPDPQAEGLKAAIADAVQADPDGMMLGNGSSELIHHICRILRPDRVTVAVPAFAEYERAAAGAELTRFVLEPEGGFALRSEQLATTAAASDVTFFCNPASPSGRLYSRNELLPALAACREDGATLVVDESFMGFCAPDEARTATLMPEAAGGGLVVISTLTKLFALAGLRGPGYLVTAPPLARRLEDAAAPWRVNVLAEAAARAALSDDDYLARTRALVPAWRKELRAGLEALLLFRIFPSSANFLLLCLREAGNDAGAMIGALGRRGILVRDCRNFAGLDERFLRVAVRPPREIAALVEGLKAATEEVRKSKG